MLRVNGLFAARFVLLVALGCASSHCAVGFAQERDGAGADTWPENVPEAFRSALDEISPQRMEGDLSFIASDLLGGRDTPSPGLDMAALYIASQFRSAGLEPVGDDEYFQTARWVMLERGRSEFAGSIFSNGREIVLDYDAVTIQASSDSTLAAGERRLVRIGADNVALFDSLDKSVLDGAVVLTDLANWRTASGSDRNDAFSSMQTMLRKAAEVGVALVVAVDASTQTGSGFGTGELVDPEADDRRRRGVRFDVPVIWSHSSSVAELFASLEDGVSDAKADFTLGAVREEAVALRNVVGMVRGSDPELRDECVLVTAHYDHIGQGSPVDGDGIFNGANDDGSGTVSVISLARAFGSLEPSQRPARSVLFVAVFGEERGLLGSQYYVRNPIVPLKKTVGNINLEQVGRTDSDEGLQERRISLTGYGFSTLTDAFVEAGQVMGVEVYDHPARSASFFARSDNVAFAAAGIPAHTLCVAYVYPDYHGRGDHWEKVDYANMAAVGRMTGLGVYLLAQDAQAPAWNRDHRMTGRYVQAWESLHGTTSQSEP